MNLAAIADLEAPSRREPSPADPRSRAAATIFPRRSRPSWWTRSSTSSTWREGDKIPRKGGPAIRYSDLLVINKIELAPHVGADLDVMARDARLMRGEKRPFLFCDLKSERGLDDVVGWLRREYLFGFD